MWARGQTLSPLCEGSGSETRLAQGKVAGQGHTHTHIPAYKTRTGQSRRSGRHTHTSPWSLPTINAGGTTRRLKGAASSRAYWRILVSVKRWSG